MSDIHMTEQGGMYRVVSVAWIYTVTGGLILLLLIVGYLMVLIHNNTAANETDRKARAKYDYLLPLRTKAIKDLDERLRVVEKQSGINAPPLVPQTVPPELAQQSSLNAER